MMLVILIAMLMLAAILSVIRCWKGPDWTDRLLTFDLLNTILIAAATLYGIYADNSEMISLVLVLAPLSFITSAFFVFFMERKKGG